MGDVIRDALERAGQEAFTRPPLKTTQARINFLLRHKDFNNSARALAAELGVHVDSVRRYRRGGRKRPPKAIAARIDVAVRARWQPGVRRRRERQAVASGGITVETRARFGYTAPVGTTDDGRMRRLTVHLPPEYARRLFDARDAGATDQDLRAIVAEGFKEIYFQDRGSRAMELTTVELKGIDYLDVSY